MKCDKPKALFDSFYPNPSRGNLSFVFNEAINKNLKIRFLNALGRVIVERNYKMDNTTFLHVENLDLQGVFMVEILLDGEVLKTERVVFL